MDIAIATLYNIDIYIEPINEYTDYMLTEIWIRPTITYCLVACFVTEAKKAAEEAAKKRQDELFAKLQAAAPAPEEEKSRQAQQEIEAKMSEANRKLKDLLTNPTDRKD